MARYRTATSLLAFSCAVSVALVVAACGGGGSGAKQSPTSTAAAATSASRTSTSATTSTGSLSPVALTGTAAGSTASAATNDAGTPGTGQPGAAGGITTGNIDGAPTAPPGANDTTTAGTPQPSENEPPTPSDLDKTIAAAAPADVAGGDPNEPPHVVSTVPAPPAGSQPHVDPTSIAPPDVADQTLQVIVDMDASTPGIQSTRDVNIGDVFRVAIVVVAAPQYENGLGGINSVQFDLDYNRAELVAPTIEGGASANRNPALNVAGLGGDAAQWTCLPAAQGDRDDPGSVDGDGDPATGQAFLACFSPGFGHTGGTAVLATVEFHAVAAGTSTLSLSGLELGDTLSTVWAHCAGDPNDPKVPCIDGTVIVH